MSAPARSALRDTLLSAAAAALEGAGVTVTGPVRVVISHGPDALRLAGEPSGEVAGTLPRLPSSWVRILDILSGAGDWLPATEVHRRLNPKSSSDRAAPEVYARLADMEEAGLIEGGRAGFRVKPR